MGARPDNATLERPPSKRRLIVDDNMGSVKGRIVSDKPNRKNTNKSSAGRISISVHIRKTARKLLLVLHGECILLSHNSSRMYAVDSTCVDSPADIGVSFSQHDRVMDEASRW
jgi:hypothetical protein